MLIHKKMISAIIVLFILAVVLMRIKTQSGSLDEFVRVESKKRFPKITLVQSKVELSEELAQDLREKLFKKVIVNEEIKRDPSLYFKAEQKVKTNGVLIAEGTMNGSALKYLVAEPEKCSIKNGDYLKVETKKDFKKLCNLEYEALISQLSKVDIRIQFKKADTIPDDLIPDWQALIDESVQSLALNSAFEKKTKKLW